MLQCPHLQSLKMLPAEATSFTLSLLDRLEQDWSAQTRLNMPVGLWWPQILAGLQRNSIFSSAQTKKRKTNKEITYKLTIFLVYKRTKERGFPNLYCRRRNSSLAQNPLSLLCGSVCLSSPQICIMKM